MNYILMITQFGWNLHDGSPYQIDILTFIVFQNNPVATIFNDISYSLVKLVMDLKS